MATIYARQAIQIRYLGPTNSKGSRVKAWCEAGSLTLSWDDSLDPASNYFACGIALARKLGWRGSWHLGALPSRDYVLVNACEDTGKEI